jgi:D-alanine transaminase
MPHITYVNGRYVAHGNAVVQVEDRGYQFADGVYEVIAVHRCQMINAVGHFDRLDRSLGELRISWPKARRVVEMITREVVKRNRIRHGMIYLQITRGVAPRDHAFPADTPSSLVINALQTPAFDRQTAAHGVEVVTLPDIRWQRRDIKSISLLPNILGKQHAVEAGAYEGWMVDEAGFVTEGTASNAWIVTDKGDLVTRPSADNTILNGITRQSILAIAKAEGITLFERPFTVEEALNAREAFLTSTTSFLKPVVRIDGRAIGNGRVGTLSEMILTAYGSYMDRDAHATT